MFEGVIEQFRPAMHKCEVWSSAVLARLASIESKIGSAANSDEFGDRVLRLGGPAVAGTPVSLGAVPMDQLWVLDYFWGDVAGWTLTLAGVPRYGPGATLASANGLVMLPGEEWFVTVTAPTNFAGQVTRQYRLERPKAAHSGNGYPEGMTSSQGPPIHERERDALPLPLRVAS